MTKPMILCQLNKNLVRLVFYQNVGRFEICYRPIAATDGCVRGGGVYGCQQR